MKRNYQLNQLSRLVAIFLIAFGCALGVSAQEHLTGDTQPEPGDNAPFPDISLIQADGTSLTKSDLIPNRPITVFYFDPDCDHCAQQAEWVVEKILDFRGTQMVWITWGELDAMKGFANKYFGGGAKSIRFGKDTNYAFDNWFGYSEVPSIYVYNAQWQRIASFKHETKAENILKVLGK